MRAIKKPVLLPLAIFIAILTMGVSLGVYWYAHSVNRADLRTAIEEIRQSWELGMNNDAAMMSATLAAVLRNAEIRDAFVARDRERLLGLTRELFGELRGRHGITHFYFTQPDKINFLRVHQPDRHGDLIGRHTTRVAHETGVTTSGLEMGPLGTFTLRVVMPWIEGKNRIGLVELGMEVDHRITEIHKLHHVDLYFLVPKRHLQRAEWEAGMAMLKRTPQWDAFADIVLVDRTASPPSGLLDRFDGAKEQNGGRRDWMHLAFGESRVNVARLPVADVEGRENAFLVFVQDVTTRYNDSQRLIFLVIAIALLGGGGLILFFAGHLERIETRLREHEAALLESEARFRSIATAAQDAIIMIDDQDVVQFWNPAAQRIFGYSAEEMEGRELHRLLAPERFHPAATRGMRRLRETGEGNFLDRTVELVGMRKNGEEFPFDLSISAIRYRECWCAIGILRDITARKEIEQRLKLGFTIIEQALEGIIITDAEAVIRMVNPAFTQLTGYAPGDVIGQNPRLLGSGRHDASFFRELWQTLNGTGSWRGELWNRRKNGEVFPEWLSISAIRNEQDEVTHYMAIFSDITERKAFERQLENLAFYDALTAIPNRMLFHQRLEQALREAARHRQRVGVFYLDLDLFKAVNDTHGHKVGDLLLQAVSTRLQELLRQEDTVARLGGDEFAILLRHVQNLDDTRLVADKIIASLTRPFHLQGIECRIGTSIGITLFPDLGQDPETLLKQADTAMYHAKRGGRNRCRIHGGVEEGQ
ncbi:MAG: PAS domain S-box protein [Magnetococcales bacterium]|nr:PAS domain S-box protein [Magnetococcales bacterium]